MNTNTLVRDEHTPSPWIISELNDAIDGEEDILIEHEGFPLATVRGTNDMSCFDDDEEIEKTNKMVIANAKLIAAAPDLLDALIEINSEDYDYALSKKQLCAVIYRLKGIAHKAIKKATL